jgi:riboflavin kinase
MFLIGGCLYLVELTVLLAKCSSVGVQAAKASGAKVVAVPSLQSQRQFYSMADLILYSLLDFHPELWGLPPFEDCNPFSINHCFYFS